MIRVEVTNAATQLFGDHGNPAFECGGSLILGCEVMCPGMMGVVICGDEGESILPSHRDCFHGTHKVHINPFEWFFCLGLRRSNLESTAFVFAGCAARACPFWWF